MRFLMRNQTNLTGENMSELLELKLSEIQRDPHQPRQDFNEESLNELADSIRVRGVIQAITVRKTPEDIGGPGYMIIAGERRWRASQLADKETIPVILKSGVESNEDEIRAQQLTENLFREDLNPVEKAEFIQKRVEELKSSGVTDAITHVADELGVSASWVSKNTAILKVSEDIRSLARTGKIRDYGIVKKLDKLKGLKRKEALGLIENDEFNAKEFFKRKRYDIKKDGEDEGGTQRKVRKRLVFSGDEIINLIKTTKYSEELRRSDEDWEDNHDKLDDYLKAFKSWVAETSSKETEEEGV